jgi:thiol-disulfide isomerase/thioredoxin
MPDLKPYWIFIAGMILMLIVVALMVADSGPVLGPGGTRWRRWSPSRPSAWLGPGGTRHLLGGYTTEGFADRNSDRLNLSSQLAGYEGFYDAGDATFTMFGVDWCPHCVAAKPEFEKLGATKTIGGKTVNFRVINPEQDKQSAAGYDIQGYPSFFLDQGGQRTKYSGGRTAADFEAWLAKTL